MQREDTSVFREHFVSSEDGLILYVREYGGDNGDAKSRLPVVCLAGLSRNSRDFHELAVQLSTQSDHPRRVITLDYRGRGRSGYDADSSHYQLPIEARDVVTICNALKIPKANFIGTSRGGLILHLLAASQPELLNSIILNDIGPVVEHSGLLHIRDYLSISVRFQDWPSVISHLKQLHIEAFPALTEHDWTDMAYALYRFSGQNIIADYDPALVDTLKDIKADEPLPDIWPLFEKLSAFPLLIIRGERSSILSQNTVADMVKRHPNATAVTVRGQGHAPVLHLEPARQSIQDFLAHVD